MSDLYATAVQYGNRFYGVFKTPGRKERFVQAKGQRTPFNTELEAHRAATNALCGCFRDTSRGWRQSTFNGARKEAEALFDVG